MKSKIFSFSFFTLILSLVFITQAKSSSKGTYFSIRVADQPNDTAILGYYAGPSQYVYDTFYTDKKGRFKVELEDPLQGGLYLVAFPNDGYFEFVYSKNENAFSISTKLSSPVASMKIKNSPENVVFNDFQRLRNKQGIEMDSLYAQMDRFQSISDSAKAIRKRAQVLAAKHKEVQFEYAKEHNGSLTTELVMMMREPQVPELKTDKTEKAIDTLMYRYRYIKNHYWDELNFNDERIIRTPLYKAKIFKYLGPSFTPQHPDSIAKWAIKVIELAYQGHPYVFRNTLNWIADKYETSELMGMEAVFTELAARYYLTDKVTWLSNADREKIKDRYNKTKWNKIDAKAQNLVMIDINGIPRALDFVDAKVTLLYFYSATCGHCKEITPKVYDLYKEYRDKGFEVFAVSIDNEEVKNEKGELINLKVSKDWQDYVKKNKFEWINVSDPSNQSNFRTYYDIYSTPVFYVLDKNKKIIGKRIDHITLRRFLMKEIDGMSHDEIDKWMKENGYVNENEED